MKLTWLSAAAALALTGCVAGNSGTAASPAAAFASIRAPEGPVVAQATIRQAGHSLVVRLDATALEPGTYGVHIHSVGRCEPPAFASAGPHWNPNSRQHGKENPMGKHMGDLPNLVVGADGRGSYEFTIADANLDALFDADGAAVVIHAQADDYRTDPSGNSGARIGCGVVSGDLGTRP